MTELAQPDERIAWLNWTHRTWGHDYPVSGDTLAMAKAAKLSGYFDPATLPLPPLKILVSPRGYGKSYALAQLKSQREAAQSC